MDEGLKQSKLVENLIKKAEGDDAVDLEVVTTLRVVAHQEHANGCALGAVPACTCGKREATDFIKAL